MEEAERYLKDGDKATQKSFFKKPNWDAAASHFEKAAQKFAALGMTAKAHETWNRAADAHAKAGNWFFVGRNYEAVANSCKMAKEYDQTADYLEKAAEAYVTANQLDKSADMLSDAAKAILARYPFGFSDKLGDAAAMQRVDRAISLLQASYDRHIDVERYHAVPPVYQTLLTTIVRRKKYVDAANAIRHYCTRVAGDALNRPHEVAHGLLEEVGLRLTAGGLADADDALQAALARSPAVMGTAAYSLAGAIVDAVRDMDADALADAVKHQELTFINVEVCKVMRESLGVLGQRKRPAVTPSAAAAGAAVLSPVGAPMATIGSPAAAAAAASPEAEAPDDLGALFDAAQAGNAGEVTEVPDIC